MEENKSVGLKDDERIKKLEVALEEKRTFYKEEINKLIYLSSDFEKIPEIQVNMLSIRHQLVDYLTADLARAYIQGRSAYEKKKHQS
jgi:hypothetical protein